MSRMIFPSKEDKLANAAFTYATWGWPVHPLKPQAKVPLTSRGLLDATTRLDLIEAWWSQWPDANIGLRTGVAFDVLDIDGEEGLASFNLLAPDYYHNGPVSTTGRGWHLLFATSGRRNGANLLPKIDFRGLNGYIVAPPSIHPSGATYHWERFVQTLPEVPDWITKISTDPPKPAALLPLSGQKHRQYKGTMDQVAEFNTMGVELRSEAGNRLRGRCPFHQDDTPSLVVYLDSNSWFCHGCNAWGDGWNLRRFQETGKLR